MKIDRPIKCHLCGGVDIVPFKNKRLQCFECKIDFPIPKNQCGFCDEIWSMEYYTKRAPTAEVEELLSLWKICTEHAQEVDAANTVRQKAEIERSVA